MLALILVGGAVAFYAFRKTSNTVATAASSDAIPHFQTQPAAGGSVNVADLFDNATTSDSGNVQVVASNSTLFVVKSTGLVRSSSSSYENVVAGIDRNSGKVVWRVADKDLEPTGGSSAGAFFCARTQTSDSIICTVQENVAGSGSASPATSSDGVSSSAAATVAPAPETVALTLINIVNGSVKTSEVSGHVNGNVISVGSDVLVTRTLDMNGNYEIARVDPSTGKDKWTQEVTSVGDGSAGPYNIGTQLFVTEKTATDQSVTTVQLDPESGKRLRSIPGYARPEGANYLTNLAITGADGTQSQSTQLLDQNKKIVWKNSNVQVLTADYGDSNILLAKRYSDSSSLVGLNIADGKVAWTKGHSLSQYISRIAGPDAFLVSDQIVTIIKLADGTELGRATGNWVDGDADIIYTTVGTSDNKRLLASKATDGTQLWRAAFTDIAPAASSSATVTSVDGALFILDAQTVTELIAGK